MISHIYVALGSWDEVISSNTKSFEVSEARLRRLGQPIYKRSHHALHWLQYGLLQQGRYEEALSKVRIMDQDTTTAASRSRNGYLAVMQAAQVVETGRTVPISTDLSAAKMSLTAAAAYFFAESWQALLEEQPERARAALKELDLRMDQSRREQVAQSTRDTPEDLQIAQVLALELEALLLKAEGNSAQALERLSQAAALESSLPLEFGPPRIIKPAHELYGELLFELDRPLEAEKQFAEALRRGPGRAHALFGLARSALANHNLVTAGDASRQLKSMWKTADSDLSHQLAELDRLLSTSDTVSGRRR
jgi:tetratricopeptide (TPR) repeat protein